MNRLGLYMVPMLLTAMLSAVAPMVAQDDLCMDGILLFREDFGGNDPNDPDVSMASVPGMDPAYRNSGNSLGSGNYTIRKEGWLNGIQWHRQDDHTYPDDKTRGYLLEIDGIGGEKPFYSKTIDGLCAGSRLTFSAYVVNVHYAGQLDYFGGSYIFPRLKFVLKHPVTGTILASQSTGDIQPDWRYGTPETWKYARENALSAEWQLIGMNFTVPEGIESVQMYIYNDVAQNGTGNDFALDDIEIHLCLPKPQILSDSTVCRHADHPFNVDFANDGTLATPLEYKWWHSADSLTWTEIAGAASARLLIPNMLDTDSGWYRVAVAGAGNIERANCRAVSDPFFLRIEECPLPPVSVIAPDTVCIDTKNTLIADLENDGSLAEPLEYQWYFSTDSLTWAPLAEGHGRELKFKAKPSHAGWYKVVVAGSGNIDKEYLCTVSEPHKLFVIEECPPILCADGILLFREDFGGNDPNDPRISTVTVNGMTYNQLTDDSFGSMRSGSYLITKSGYCNGDTTLNNAPQNRRSQWHLQDDHTYPNDNSRGYFMEIDGKGDHAAFYTTTIDGLCAGSDLSFVAYVANVMTWGQYVGSPGRYAYPRLLFRLTDPTNGAVLGVYDTGEIPFDSTFMNDYSCWKYSSQWHQVGMNFTVPEGLTSITLTIYNNAVGNIGNDFAIDDIEIRLCLEPISINPFDSVCRKQPHTLQAVYDNYGILYEPEYQWFFSPDSAVWTPVQVSPAPTYTIPAVHRTDEGWYRVTVAETGNSDQVNCRSVSEPFRLNSKYCGSATDQFIDTTVCDTLLPVEWRTHLWQHTGTVIDTIRDFEHDDSIYIYLSLSTQKCCPEIQRQPVQLWEICDTLLPYTWFFRDTALVFEDISDVHYIEVQHPRWDCIDSIYILRLDTVHCEKLWPVIVNKYNRVLLLDNIRFRQFFPGRSILSMQWYKDEQPLPGATEDDYSEPDELHGRFQLFIRMDADEHAWSNIIELLETDEPLPVTKRVYNSMGMPVPEDRMTRGVYLLYYEQGDHHWTEKQVVL